MKKSRSDCLAFMIFGILMSSVQPKFMRSWEGRGRVGRMSPSRSLRTLILTPCAMPKLYSRYHFDKTDHNFNPLQRVDIKIPQRSRAKLGMRAQAQPDTNSEASTGVNSEENVAPVESSSAVDEGVIIDDEDSMDDSMADDEDYLSVTSPGIKISFPWGEDALSAAQRLLSENPSLADIAIYSFNTRNRARLEVSLDKLNDPRGSPTLDEVSLFARDFRAYLEEDLGERADNIEIEVSTAGAEREIRLPNDLHRFSQFPMLVKYRNSSEGGIEKHEAHIMDFNGLDEDTGMTEWRLADVKANRWTDKRGKIMPIRRKDREKIFQIALQDLKQVNMHLDV
eukprot:CAMPEP_0184492882 /NCGR_PEP_ID=MMETSP0113_2-20130426/24503_1 /TAXON_ID=91329 /ORGANISM="Norrisiella sphaerica, Strain BC52" /LENGTH=338 /DNA_ID=CAMNT_0026877905 /DNA_START=67 /DNA_END=1083 /DNA_ORIENTATION=-